jgi:CBS domain containing-hemolysin-like protein
MQYFDVHVFHSRKDGYSVPVAMSDKNEDDAYMDEEVIESAVAQGILDSEEANYVDSVDDINEQEYNQMKG